MATIRKRGKRWQVQVRTGGVSSSKSFATKHEAAGWARAQEAAVGGASADKLDAGGVTVGELVDAYKVTSARNGRKWGETKDACLLRLRDRLGYIHADQISKRHVQEFARQRAAEGAGGRTIHDDLSYLSTVLRFGRAVLDYDIPSDVVKDANMALQFEGVVKPNSNKRRRRISDAEIEAIKAEWTARTIRVEIIDFAVLTAMRAGEILRIREEDIDADARTLVIHDRKHPSEKVGNTMTIPLLGGSLEILQRGLFPYQRRSVSQAFRAAAERAGVEDIRFHDLRGECLSRLGAQGWTAVQLMALSGHTSLATLAVYTDVTPEELHGLVKK